MDPVVLAHGNGLDEIAGVLVPLAGIVILLRAGAKRRAAEEAERAQADAESTDAENTDAVATADDPAPTSER